VAGGLASASNVFAFQLFASVPADTLAYGAMLLVAGVACLSGVLFAGVLGKGLVNALRQAGVVKDAPPAAMGRAAYALFLLVAAGLSVFLALYLQDALRGPPAVHIGGAVQAPYDYPTEHADLAETSAEGTLNALTSRYAGVPLRDLLAGAQPEAGASLVLARASDGYAFFLSMDEIAQNDSLLLSPQGEGEERSYNIVGAQNSKAWVRGVEELTVVGTATLKVEGALTEATPFDPDDWQFDMDSTRLDLGDGPRKLQGVPLGKVLQAMEPEPGADTVVVHTPEGEPVTLPLADVLGDDDLRLFTVIGEADVRFALARMDGQVLAAQVARIEVR
jgi:hypothetical protein